MSKISYQENLKVVCVRGLKPMDASASATGHLITSLYNNFQFARPPFSGTRCIHSDSLVPFTHCTEPEADGIDRNILSASTARL